MGKASIPVSREESEDDQAITPLMIMMPAADVLRVSPQTSQVVSTMKHKKDDFDYKEGGKLPSTVHGTRNASKQRMSKAEDNISRVSVT